MYIGRFVIVGPDIGAYRVSSRSFPNRKIIERDSDVFTVVPTADAPETDNPYVSYNCLRKTTDRIVIGNGTHVDPITEKIGLGYPPRDALAESLLALDFEKDEYDTPRIAGVIGSTASIGIVRRDALLVETVEEPTIVATYEMDAPAPVEFPAETAEEASRAAYELDYDHPICAVGAARTDGEWAISIVNDISE